MRFGGGVEDPGVSGDLWSSVTGHDRAKPVREGEMERARTANRMSSELRL